MLLLGGKAVKAVPVSSAILPEVEHEVAVYHSLRALQDEGVIPRVLQSGFCLGGAYFGFVMDLHGSSLASLPAEQQHERAGAARHALRRVHQSGFAHGDVRLENFVVSASGGTMLLDFGFAEPLSGDAEADEEMRQLECLLACSDHA